MSSLPDVNFMLNLPHRLASFESVGHELERRDGGLGHFAIQLARRGFFRSGNYVVCGGCRKRTSFEDLHYLGEPFHNHECRIAMEEEEDDVNYIQQFQVSFQTNSSPTHSFDDLGIKLKNDLEFVNLATRLRSFQELTWANSVLADQLSRHGLYYIGVGDTLRCFKCKLQFPGVSVKGVERIIQDHTQSSTICSNDSTTN